MELRVCSILLAMCAKQIGHLPGRDFLRAVINKWRIVFWCKHVEHIRCRPSQTRNIVSAESSCPQKEHEDIFLFSYEAKTLLTKCNRAFSKYPRIVGPVAL
jgi:hypothetical protein